MKKLLALLLLLPFAASADCPHPENCPSAGNVESAHFEVAYIKDLGTRTTLVSGTDVIVSSTNFLANDQFVEVANSDTADKWSTANDTNIAIRWDSAGDTAVNWNASISGVTYKAGAAEVNVELKLYRNTSVSLTGATLISTHFHEFIGASLSFYPFAWDTSVLLADGDILFLVVKETTATNTVFSIHNMDIHMTRVGPGPLD